MFSVKLSGHEFCLDKSIFDGSVVLWKCHLKNNPQWTYTAETGQVMSMWGGCWDIGGKIRNKKYLTFTFCFMFYFFLLCIDLIVKSFKVTIENIKAAHFWPLCGNQTVTGGSQHHILRQRTKLCISTFHHYSDVIMSTMTSQITRVSFLLNRLFMCR